MEEAMTEESINAQPSPESVLRWHVCPQRGLAGWARVGFGYCRRHSELPEEPFAALRFPIAPGKALRKDGQP
jgi:hypothetical protein